MNGVQRYVFWVLVFMTGWKLAAFGRVEEREVREACARMHGKLEGRVCQLEVKP